MQNFEKFCQTKSNFLLLDSVRKLDIFAMTALIESLISLKNITKWVSYFQQMQLSLLMF